MTEKQKQEENVGFINELLQYFDIRQLRVIFSVCNNIVGNINKELIKEDLDNDENDYDKIISYINDLLQHLNNKQLDIIYYVCEALIEEYQEI